LANRKIIEQTSHDVYTYGFELIISAAVNILLMAILSVVFRRYYDWLLFLAAFVPLRTAAGGYHASSHGKCLAVGTITFAVLLAVCRLQLNWTRISLVVAAMSLILILIFSPLEAPNKNLKVDQRRKNRLISIGIGTINLIMAGAALWIEGLAGILNIYFAGVFAAALSMLAVKIQIAGERCIR
jgi:accessory gene regulator B